MKGEVKPRKFKPRDVAVQAAFVSQETSLAVLGIGERRFLELLVPRCNGAVAHLGRLRLVPIDVAVAKLRELAADGADVSEGATQISAAAERQPETPAEVLAALGRRPSPSP